MKLSSLMKFLLGVLTAISFSTVIYAQSVVSSGMTGVVQDNGGKPIVGATVTAAHVPTGRVYTAATNQAGRFSFGGMAVGGPYTITARAAGFNATRQENLETSLGNTVDANLRLEAVAAEVVTLEKFVVKGENNELDSSASGAGSVITRGAIDQTATVQRSFADIARTNPYVNLRSVLASRAQPIISALGQNNRFNSIRVDGARINDQFGLNGSGLQAFGNPISLDTIEQFSVTVSPYDVSQSGFTGASINAVTKSGTNQFHGSAYYYYTDQDRQGANVFGSTAGTRAALEQKTKGLTFGGPILKNRLFFFINYEKFDSTTSDTAGLDPTATAQGTADLAAINARLTAIKTAVGGSSLDFGTFPGRTAAVTQFNEISLVKIDWNISTDHRLSVRYNKTEGNLPVTGYYNRGGNGQSGYNPLAGSGIANSFYGTNLSSNGYAQARKEEVGAAQVFSQWSPNLKTEVRYAQNSYSQQTPVPILFPEINIFGISGLSAAGTTLTGAGGAASGAIGIGTERNRQGNVLKVDTKSYSASGEYLWRDYVLSGGFDHEESTFYNLFRGSSYGVFDFASVQDFVNDIPRTFLRSVYVKGTNPADESEFSINGIYGQAKWQPNRRLNVNFGLRYDWFTSGIRPPLNKDFVTAFGFGNDATIDGTTAVSPRVGFNYAVDDSRVTQLRGGVGHFVGRIPWVMVSNSFGNSGVGRSQIGIIVNSAATPTPKLVDYVKTSFDAKDPIGNVTSATLTRPSINLIAKNLQPPSVWRGNLAVDRKLTIFDSILTLELIHTRASQAMFYKDLNLKPRLIGSDGRQVFFGASSVAASALNAAFSNVLELSNTKEGTSTNASISLQRPMKNGWSAGLTYVRGASKDAFPLGETVAGSFFSRNPVFNQNRPEVARSAFEIRDRVQLSYAREFEFVKKYKTTFSLYFEGRTGNPYSLVYTNDVNQDGTNGNDIVYVPAGTTDPVMSQLTPAVAAAYMSYIDGSILGKYKGGVVPRHSLLMPWINRLDLHIGQRIPLFKQAEFEVFADFVNFGAWLSKSFFGYTETITGAGDNELFATAQFGNAAYDAAGQLRMNSPTFVTPIAATPNNELSRWRMQFGARLRF
ncbi:MAG: TonB-dependent receptor [Opitutus sp.]|nr:TonB-dependent receptor [Opitutus sp.]